MTYAPKIQGDFALNQIVVHLALVTRSIAGPGNQASREPVLNREMVRAVLTVILTSNIVLHSRHVYGPQYRVENQYDDFVKVMPR